MKLGWVIALTAVVWLLLVLAYTPLCHPPQVDRESGQLCLSPLTPLYMGLPFRLVVVGLAAASLAVAIQGLRQNRAKALGWAIVVVWSGICLAHSILQASYMPQVLQVYFDLMRAN